MALPNHAGVVIVGAGAAGVACGIFAARHAPGLAPLIVDGARTLGAKILVAGGGRCNVTNVAVTPRDYYGGNPNVLRRVLAEFPASAAREFFAEIGVALHEEEHGKLFPDSNSGRTVLAALLGEAQRRGVRVHSGQRVVGIARRDGGFELTVRHTEPTPGEHTLRAERVVLATGGLSLPKTGSDGAGYTFAQALGHTLVPTTPGLAPLVLEGEFHAPLAGIAHPAELGLHVAEEKPVRLHGDLLWTHFGVSGPLALNASRFWHRARLAGRTVDVKLNFLPGDDFTRAEQRVIDLAAQQPRAALHNALATLLPARVAEAVCGRLGLAGSRPIGQLGREDRRRLVHALLEWPLPVRDSRGYAYAEVTAGGVPLAEIDPSTLASRCCSGLYLAGEILDVDGRIGGFNFQWAWASGFVAGKALARGAGS